jgi:hypothetical protein
MAVPLNHKNIIWVAPSGTTTRLDVATNSSGQVEAYDTRTVRYINTLFCHICSEKQVYLEIDLELIYHSESCLNQQLEFK